MSARVLKIGRTNYYSVRKGQQQYCIVEGRRVQDLEHCWQVLRDPDSGRNFFVNRAGVRRWHLPDIFQTERERAEEERALRFRRQQKKQEEIRREQQQRGGGVSPGAEGSDGSSARGPSADGADDDAGGESEALRGIVNNKELFAARDAAARQLPPLRGWETPALRKPVTRAAKAILSPYFHQGVIDAEALAALVTTGTREFCATHSTLGPAEREAFARELKSLVKSRIDEDDRRNEFQRMNEDLLERLKRLDVERKEQAARLAEGAKNEEEMRQELFRLRAHKQDVLLHSFKRLTRAGLVQTYWERWTRYKAIVEAQNHVNARERRAREMAESIAELQETLKEREAAVQTLLEAEQRRRAKDVIDRILGQLGRDVQQRFFVKWVKFAIERKRERELFMMRSEMENCPRCAQRSVDMDRVSAMSLEAWQATHGLQRRLLAAAEEAGRHHTQSLYWRAVADFSAAVATDARQVAQTHHLMRAGREQQSRAQERRIRELTREVDGLRFEVSVGGGGAAAAQQAAALAAAAGHHPDDDAVSLWGGGGAASAISGGATFPSAASVAGGHRHHHHHHHNAAGAGAGGAAPRPADDQQLTNFFAADAGAAGSRLEHRLASRGDAGLPPPADGVVTGGPRGAVEAITQSAIAPNVFGRVAGGGGRSNHTHSNSMFGTHGSHQPHGGKYYDPVIVDTSSAAAAGGVGGAAAAEGAESAFDRRTREIAHKKEMLRLYGTTNPTSVAAAGGGGGGAVVAGGRSVVSSPPHNRGSGNDEYSGSRRRRRRGRSSRSSSSDSNSARSSSGSSRSSSSSSTSDSDGSSASSYASSAGSGGPTASSGGESERRHRRRRKRKQRHERRRSSQRGEANTLSASPSNTSNANANNNAAGQQQPDPLSRYMAEKAARAQQAAVLRFIRPPMSAEEVAAARQKALAEAYETAEEKEARRCQKCGFRYDSAAFCPKDGTRHTFRPLALAGVPVEGIPQSQQQQQQQQPTNAIGGSGPLPEAVAKLLAMKKAEGGVGATADPPPTLAQLPNHRDDPMRALALPEPQTTASTRLLNSAAGADGGAPRHLRLPPGMLPANDDGTLPDEGPPPPPPHPLVQRHTDRLRSSLDLNPLSYKQPRLYTIGDGDGAIVPAPVRHPRDTEGARQATLEAEAVYRDTVDNIRFTRIMTEATTRLAERTAAPNSAAHEARLRTAKAERSAFAGYNPTADPDNALSLESRLFSGRRQTEGLATDSLAVPNYFAPATTRSLAAVPISAASNNPASANRGLLNHTERATPSLVQERLDTPAAAYYPDLRQEQQQQHQSHQRQGWGGGGGGGFNGGSSGAVVPTTHRLLSEAERVQRNIHSFNERAAAIREGGGGAVGGPSTSSSSSPSSWSNVFQYNDVLFGRGLGLNVGDAAAAEAFGTRRETSETQRPPNAQVLSAQMQATPNFALRSYGH